MYRSAIEYDDPRWLNGYETENGVMFFIVGIIAIIIGMLGFADFIGKDTKFSWLISAVIGLSSGAYFVYMGFSRIQVYENVILVYVDSQMGSVQ